MGDTPGHKNTAPARDFHSLPSRHHFPLISVLDPLDLRSSVSCLDAALLTLLTYELLIKSV